MSLESPEVPEVNNGEIEPYPTSSPVHPNSEKGFSPRAGGNGEMSQLEGLDVPLLYVKAERAMREAVAAAIAEHWKAGRPVYFWEEGRIVAVLPDGSRIPLKEGQYELDPPQE
jgi:hypothetical protein